MVANSKELRLMSQDFNVGAGSYPDIIPVRKFGSNPVIGTTEEDVWSVGGTETLMTTAAAMYISCEATGQTQTITVQGLDENWDIIEETVVLNGQTKTQIGTSLWLRVHRAYQVSAGAAPTDDVWIYEDDTVTLGVPQTASKIHGHVDYASTSPARQTEKCAFTIPRGYIGLIHHLHAEMGDITTGAARSAHIYVMQQTLAEGATVDNPSWSPFRRIDIGHEISTSSNSDITELVFPIRFDELTNVVTRAVATADSLISAEFDLVLVPK